MRIHYRAYQYLWLSGDKHQLLWDLFDSMLAGATYVLAPLADSIQFWRKRLCTQCVENRGASFHAVHLPVLG